MAGRDKIIKHYSKCNWICCISLVLDPTFKYKGFDTTRWGLELKKESIRRFEKLFTTQYYLESEMAPAPENSLSLAESMEDPLGFSKVYSSNESTPSWKMELNEYTQSRTANYGDNILEWWKKNQGVYPNLARMARDILGITPTTVFIERFFSGGPLLMTQKRTSMADKTLKKLMCLYSWSKSSLKKQIYDE